MVGSDVESDSVGSSDVVAEEAEVDVAGAAMAHDGGDGTGSAATVVAVVVEPTDLIS
jgi:hypothetical protein